MSLLLPYSRGVVRPLPISVPCTQPGFTTEATDVAFRCTPPRGARQFQSVRLARTNCCDGPLISARPHGVVSGASDRRKQSASAENTGVEPPLPQESRQLQLGAGATVIAIIASTPPPRFCANDAPGSAIRDCPRHLKPSLYVVRRTVTILPRASTAAVAM